MSNTWRRLTCFDQSADALGDNLGEILLRFSVLILLRSLDHFRINAELTIITCINFVIKSSIQINSHLDLHPPRLITCIAKRYYVKTQHFLLIRFQNATVKTRFGSLLYFNSRLDITSKHFIKTNNCTIISFGRIHKTFQQSTPTFWNSVCIHVGSLH